MSDENSRPTPPAGMAALDSNGQVLAAIQQLREESRERGKEASARFEKLEADAALMRGAVADLQAEVGGHTKMLASHANSMTEVSTACARAASLALEAKQDTSRSADDAAKLVKSAIEIHGLSIAATVDAAVTKAAQPLVNEISALKKQDETQGEELAQIKAAVTTIAKALGNPALRKALIAAAIIGAMIGGGVAGYVAVREEQKTTSAPAR